MRFRIEKVDREILLAGDARRAGSERAIPASPFSRVSCSICAVCAALMPETFARTTMYSCAWSSGTSARTELTAVRISVTWPSGTPRKFTGAPSSSPATDSLK